MRSFPRYTAEVGSDTYTLIKGPGKGLVEYARKDAGKGHPGAYEDGNLM